MALPSAFAGPSLPQVDDCPQTASSAPGRGGWLASEWVAGLDWIQWLVCVGISGWFPSEHATRLLVVPRQRSRWRRMDLSPILVGKVSLRRQDRGIHRTAARDLRQQVLQRGKRTNADLRPGCEAQRHAGLWLEHPGRYLKASASIPIEAAPQRGAASSLGHLMDVDRETAPGMPRIQ